MKRLLSGLCFLLSLSLLGAAIAMTALGTATAYPKKSATDSDALSRAVAFETALTSVAESVSPSVGSESELGARVWPLVEPASRSAGSVSVSVCQWAGV